MESQRFAPGWAAGPPVELGFLSDRELQDAAVVVAARDPAALARYRGEFLRRVRLFGIAVDADRAARGLPPRRRG